MHTNMVVRFFYATTAVLVASASALAFSGVGQAQAATVGNPWVRTGGTALADEFHTIMARGGMQPVTNPAAGSSTGSASALLLGAGAGLAIGTKGLQLYSKITTGDWDTYTEGIHCGSDWVGKVGDFVGKAFKLMSFGLGGYSCVTAPGKVHTDDLATVDLSHSDLDKDAVPQKYPTGLFAVQTPYGIAYYQGARQYGVHPDEQQHVFGMRDNPVMCSGGDGFTVLGFFADGSVDKLHVAPLGGNDCRPRSTLYGDGLRKIEPGKFVNLTSLKVCTSDTCAEFSAKSEPITSRDTVKRQISCRVTAVDGSHVDKAGTTYTDADGIPLDSQQWGCNDAWQSTISAGKMPARVTATSTFPGAVGDPQVLLNKPVTESARETVTESPECMNASSNSMGCVQRLYKRVGNVLRSCADADVWEQCADWLEETKAHPEDATYLCRIGTKTVDLKRCAMYGPTFKYPRADTQLHYATDTGTDTAVDTKGATAESPDMQNCWAGIVSWNPIDWVLTPIKCAAIWAFVPSDPSTWQDVGHAWDGTPPVVVAKTLSGGIPLPEAGNGCSGPLVDLRAVGGKYLSYQGYPMSACAEPMSTMASRFRTLASVLMYATTLWMVIRNITAAVNVPPPPAAIQPTLF